MATQYVPLNTIKLNGGATLAHPASMPELVYIDDPATYGMIDFHQEDPMVIDAHQTLTSIANIMQQTHAHEALVIREHDIVGIISVRDLSGIKPNKLSEQHSVEKHEVTAEMLMTPLSEILAFDYDELLHARIGNVAVTLNSSKKAYALVVEADQENSKEQTIRGLILAPKLSEQLGKDIAQLN